MALCYLLTLYASLRATAARRGSGIADSKSVAAWQAIAIVVCAAGMAAKESMVTAPLMVLAYDRIFVFESWTAALGTRWRFYLGLAATWLLLAALVWSGARAASAGFSSYDAAPWRYLLNQTVLITHYLHLAVWPRALALYYGWPRPLTLADVWPQTLLLVALFVLTTVTLIRRPGAGFLGLWFFVTLAPASSIVPIATEVGAERRMYMPLMALVLLAVCGGTWLWELMARWSQRAPGSRTTRSRVMAGVLIAVCALLAARTVARNHEYASSLTLAETTLARWPTPGAQSMYGMELAAAGRFVEAEPHLRAATLEFPPARYYLAGVLSVTGRPDEAIAEYQQFLRDQPEALEQAHRARGQLAGLFMKEQRWPEAVALYRRTLVLLPGDLEAERGLSGALIRQRSYAEAIEHLKAVIAVTPDDMATLEGLGIALAETGRLDEAVATFRHAVEVDPSNVHAQQDLARALAMRGK
jgi:tetratricopeptide (TPR) repeat protein